MWRYAAARTVGLAHLKTGAPCQDQYEVVCNGDGLIIAVSDGAGSAAQAETGAKIAVTKAVEVLRPNLGDERADWQALVISAALSARSAIQSHAVGENMTPRDYACTLLIIVLDKRGGGAFQVGDGIIAYRDADDWGWLFWPQKGEYANTTRFLTDDDAELFFEAATFSASFTDVAVTSDGLEGLALHFATKAIHEPFLEAVLGPLRASQDFGESSRVSSALGQFLSSEKISSRTDDDLTLVIATRPGL